MTVTVWDAAMTAVSAALVAAIPDVTVEMDRRAAVDARQCPRIVLRLGDISEDLETSPGAAFHRIEIVTFGYADGATDTACRVALNTLLARTIAALNGLQSGVIFDVVAGLRSVSLLPIEQSSRAFGEFTQSFSVSAVTAAGSPYAS